jgi:hypothetical protein
MLAALTVVAILIAIGGLGLIVTGVRDEKRSREAAGRSRAFHPSTRRITPPDDREVESQLMAEIEDWLQQQR